MTLVQTKADYSKDELTTIYNKALGYLGSDIAGGVNKKFGHHVGNTKISDLSE